jgi:orotate phosphoribosyltransferase
MKSLAWGMTRSKYFLTRGESEVSATDFYFDIDVPATDPGLTAQLCDWYAGTVRTIERESGVAIRRLAFIEKDSGPVGAILLTSLLVRETGIPAVVVRNRRRLPVNAFKEKLPFQSGDAIVVISDVATSGTGIRQAIEKLWARGATVPAAIVLVNRGGEKLRLQLAQEKIELFAAIDAETRSDLETGLLREVLRETRGRYEAADWQQLGGIEEGEELRNQR